MKLPASHFLKDYSIITLGLLLYAIGFDCFLLPFEIATGGVAGAGAIIFYATGFWKVQYTYFLANAVLLVAAIKILGWKFCVKTVYATFVLTALLGGVEALMQHLYATNPGLFPAFNEAVHLPQLIDNAFMSTIFGAALCGIGIGYVFGRGGSTGGTDIIASIINKYKNMSLGTVMMLCDVLIVSSSLLLPDYNLQKVLYGFTALLVVNLTLDFIYNRGRQSVQFFIISRKYEEIATAINVYHRGVTVIDARGWYTKKSSKVLMVMAKKRESSNIFAIIQAIDPQAFVTQTLAAGVFGDGFDHMRNIKNTNDKVQNALTTAAEAEDELENAANTIVESE